jgi:carboxypeptidase C (cathepsin A)
LADEFEVKNMTYYEKQAQSQVNWGEYGKAADSWNMVLTEAEKANGGANIYNYRVYGHYNTTLIDDYLNLASTKKMLHVPDTVTYHDCDGTAYQMLTDNIMKSMASYIPEILPYIRVLLYNGQDDIIVNTPSAETWIKNMKWKYIEDYLEADKAPWMVNGKIAGYERGYENLQQLVVLKSGHMVPHD